MHDLAKRKSNSSVSISLEIITAPQCLYCLLKSCINITFSHPRISALLRHVTSTWWLIVSVTITEVNNLMPWLSPCYPLHWTSKDLTKRKCWKYGAVCTNDGLYFYELERKITFHSSGVCLSDTVVHVRMYTRAAKSTNPKLNLQDTDLSNFECTTPLGFAALHTSARMPQQRARHSVTTELCNDNRFLFFLGSSFAQNTTRIKDGASQDTKAAELLSRKIGMHNHWPEQRNYMK